MQRSEIRTAWNLRLSVVGTYYPVVIRLGKLLLLERDKNIGTATIYLLPLNMAAAPYTGPYN